jgi:glucose-1-phosphate cytidylyltransferase
MAYTLPLWTPPALPVAGSQDTFPIRRIFCVGRNYAEHQKEMGGDGREQPFFFIKSAHSIVPRGGDVHYPAKTSNYHYETEMVVALSRGGRRIDLLKKDIDDWRITFVDTGISSNIGERLKAVEPFLGNDRMFLANYADGLTDFALPVLIENATRTGAVGTFLTVRPNYSFHFVGRDKDGVVTGVEDIIGANAWINGGYFVFRREIFDYMRPGEELVEAPFQRLIAERKLRAHDYEGFWRCVDTFKDLQSLEQLYAQGRAPWQVWSDDEKAKPRRAKPEPLVLRARKKGRVREIRVSGFAPPS